MCSTHTARLGRRAHIAEVRAWSRSVMTSPRGANILQPQLCEIIAPIRWEFEPDLKTTRSTAIPHNDPLREAVGDWRVLEFRVGFGSRDKVRDMLHKMVIGKSPALDPNWLAHALALLATQATAWELARRVTPC